MTFGVTPTGFNRKTLADIVLEYETRQRAEMDPNVDVDPDSPVGQLNGIIGNAVAEVWEAQEDTYHGFNPNEAEGDQLVNVSLLTGTSKRGAAPSTVSCTLTLEAGATVPSGAIVSLSTRDDVRFELTVTVNNPSGITATFPGAFECQADGPIPALAGELTVIVTPFSGWLAVTNALDADLGHNADSNITLRQRREQQLTLQGGSTIDAIVADLLEIASIADVVSIENESDHYDPTTGLRAHTFEMMIVDDGLTDNDLIAQTIFDSKPAGISPSGSLTIGQAVDGKGKAHLVPFSRADDQLVWCILEISVSGLFPLNGEQQIIESVLARARNTFGIADDVVGGALEAAAFSIAGVTDATALIGFAPAPTLDDNLPIGLHQIARFDSSRVTVVYV